MRQKTRIVIWNTFFTLAVTCVLPSWKLRSPCHSISLPPNLEFTEFFKWKNKSLSFYNNLPSDLRTSFLIFPPQLSSPSVCCMLIYLTRAHFYSVWFLQLISPLAATPNRFISYYLSFVTFFFLYIFYVVSNPPL